MAYEEEGEFTDLELAQDAIIKEWLTFGFAVAPLREKLDALLEGVRT